MKTERLEIRNMDCMELMAEFPDNHFDLAIVDPPYNLQRFRKGIGKGERHTIKADAGFNNNAPKQEYWDELFRVSKNQIVWGANNFEMPPSEYFCVWDKKQTVDNFASAEYAWVSMGLKMPAKVFEYSIHQHNADGGKVHPTQKPVKLYDWLLSKYAKKGQKILDTHMGSGSIAIACHYAQCHLTASELDEDYFNSACERIERETRQQTLFV